MPSSNQTKNYIPNAFYHIFNRGVGKMKIFHDKQDFNIFLYYLKVILTPISDLQNDLSFFEQEEHPKDYAKMKRITRALFQSAKNPLQSKIKLLSYCLMPNHFHLIVQQSDQNDITQLMRRLATGYSMYYKKKYDWVGPVMQGRFRASCLYYNPHLQVLAAARYVERNPYAVLSRNSENVSRKRLQLIDYSYSSLHHYYKQIIEGTNTPTWLHSNFMLGIFQKIQSKPNGMLEEFVSQYPNYYDFIISDDDLTLEDVRLAHLHEIIL